MKLSFIIPAYNVESYIKSTLLSLISQTEKHFEVVIVNDGSTDDTHKIIEEFILENKLNNFNLIDKKNGGVSSARNSGLIKSKGEYVIFLDGDDYVSSDLVETIYKHFQNEQEPDVFCWGYNTVKEDKTTIVNYFEKYNSKLSNMTGTETLQNLFIKQNMHIWTGSVAYKRELLLKKNILFTEGCSNGEDQEFLIKTLLETNSILFINSILSFYVEREGSISNVYDIRRFDAINAMKRIYECIDKTNDNRLTEVSNFIKDEAIIGNYFYNFNSCISYLFTNKGISTREAFKYIFDDIDNGYSRLNESIIALMKSYKGENKKLSRRIKLFLYLPLVYCGLIKLKSKIKAVGKH